MSAKRNKAIRSREWLRGVEQQLGLTTHQTDRELKDLRSGNNRKRKPKGERRKG